MCVCVCVCVCVFGSKTKTADRNDSKLGTVVILDNMSKPVDFGFKRSTDRVTGTAAYIRTVAEHK